MLVLTRRRTESILIDSDIEIVVTAVHKNQVKVQRKELVDRPARRAGRRGKVLDFYSYDRSPEAVGGLR
jgi:hypothetical protein